MNRKTLAALLSVLMLFTMIPVTAVGNINEKASGYVDMPDNWSTAALTKAVDNGLLKGDEVGGRTLIKADAPLKRAEMAAIVNRAFNATVTAELKAVTDVSPSAWYAKDMSKAVQMRTFVLDGNLRPESNITRQEAFTVLARAFKLTSADTALKALGQYSDKADIAVWAQNSLNALAAAGYIQGSPDGRLNPNANITRAEFAVVMDNMVKQYIDKPGEVTQVASNGSVMVRVAGVILKNVTIKGDLIIADGVGAGEAILDGVKVEGRTVIRGGGVNSIIIRGNSSVGTVVVARADGAVSVKVQGDANVEVIYIDDGSDDVKLEGTLGTVEVNAPNITVTTVGANIDNVNISGDFSKVVIDKNSKLEKLNVNQGAANSSIEVAGTVAAVTTHASGTVVTGNGKITKVEAKEGADNTKVETSNTQITVDKGVTGVTGSGGTTIGSGASGTNNNAGTGLVSTAPASGGGGSTTVLVSAINVSGAGNVDAITVNNGTLQFSAVVEPANASNKNITWSVMNGTGEATISTAGLLTAVKNGTVTVKATANDGSGKSGEKAVVISGQTPVISTTSTIANGAVNPAVVVTLVKDNFTEVGSSTLSGNWIGNLGTTGLTGGTITRNSDTQMMFQLNGTAQAGTLTLQAKEGALTSGVTSNTLTITIPEAPVTIEQITAASLDMRKGSIIMGYTFEDEGSAISYELAKSDYALDDVNSTVELYQNSLQVGNTVALNQFTIGNSDVPGESAKVTFADFGTMLTAFGLAFSNPANIPTHVKVVVKSKTSVGGKTVDNPWGPIEIVEPVTSDLYTDLDVNATESSATILPGNKTAGQPFPLAITIKNAAGQALPNGEYMVNILNGATPIGGGSVAFAGGQATVNALLTAAANHTLVVKVNNVEIETLTNVTTVASPVLGSVFTTIDGTAIHLAFDKAMADPSGKHGQFAITVNGNANLVTAAALKPGDSNMIVLTLTTALAGSDTITIAYTQGDVVAVDNGILCSFIPMAVTNNVLQDQDGSPAFAVGIPATFGTELTVGIGTLGVTTNLSNTWYRSDDANYNDGVDTLLATGTAYTPIEADIGKYLIVVTTSTDAVGIGTVATDAAVEKGAGPAAITENYVGTFPAAATSINLSGLAANASGLAVAVAVDGSNYAGYAALIVDGEGKSTITGLTGVTASTKVKVRLAETSTHKAGSEKEIIVSEAAPEEPQGDLMDAASGTNFTGALYTRNGSIYYNQAGATGLWGTETLIASAATEGRIAVDSSGKPHVVYATSGKIGYRMYDGSDWTGETLIISNHSGVCSKPNIAVDSNGYAHITYTDTKGNTGDPYDDSDIMYASNSTGDFVKLLIYNGYKSYISGADQNGDFYSNGSKITLDGYDNYYILSQKRSWYKWMGGSDHTYSIIVYSNLGNGATDSEGYTSTKSYHDIYDLAYKGNKVIALYKGKNIIKTAELTESGGTISFSNIQSLSGDSVSAVATDGTDTVAGGVNGGKLQTFYNGTQTVHDAIAVKGSTVAVVNYSGTFYAVFTDNADGKIKLQEISVAP